MNFDSTNVDLECPNCSKKFSETIGRLKNDPKILCECGCTITIDSSDLRNGLSTLDESFNELQRALGNVGK